VIVSDSPRDLAAADRVVLPGVGAFRTGMERLSALGWTEALRSACDDRLPILGICLGMQLLADRGEEGGRSAGLELIPGAVERIPAAPDLRVPHVGWNEVLPRAAHPMFAQIPDNSDFYFVHSFRFVPTNAEHVVAETPYGGRVVSAIVRGSVWGVQFHPEKSARWGRQLLTNFLAA
jgi:glutamine amidotransferase